MVRERFDDAFERMRDQSNRLAETERTGENFDEIVEQRVELDRLRDEVTNERKGIVSRFEPPATDVVEPPRGYVHTKLIGKVGAVIAALLVAVVVGMFFLLLRTATNDFITLDNVVETIESTDEGCVWRVQANVRNDSDELLIIERVEAVIDRGFSRGRPGFYPTILANESAPLSVEFTLPSRDLTSGCPAVEDIDHGNVRLFLDNGLMMSVPM